MRSYFAQGANSTGERTMTSRRWQAWLFLRYGLLAWFVLPGACSAPARADEQQGISAPLDAGTDDAAVNLAIGRRQLIPAAFLLRDKLSTSDDPHLPEIVKAKHVCSSLSSVYKICVSSEGSVNTVETVKSIPGADSEIVETLRHWRFRPQAKPVCAMLNFDFEIPGKGNLCSQPSFQATNWLMQRRISGDEPHWPRGRDLPAALTGRRGAYKLCVDKYGMVTVANPVVGIPEADHIVLDALRKWNFQPLSFPVCTFEFFRISDGDIHNASSMSLAPPTAEREPVMPVRTEPTQRSKVVPAVLIRKDKVSSGDDPHLPDMVKAHNRGKVLVGSYKVCIAEDGSIGSVDVISPIQDADEQILKTLYDWRYKPQLIPICFIQFLEFHIE